MTSDSDTPEIPNQDPNNSPQPPKKSLKDIFGGDPPDAKPKPGHWFVSEDMSGQKPETTQEQAFRLTAMKFFEMEDEIIELMSRTPEQSFSNFVDEYIEAKKRGDSSDVRGVYFDDRNGVKSLTSYSEDILGMDDKPVRINITYAPEGIEHADTDLKTDRVVNIELHSDEPTREAFKAYLNKDLRHAKDTSVGYYFTKEGDYQKILFLPKEVPVDPKRKPFRDFVDPIVVKAYESEMTPGDFEVVGQALNMLKTRLLSLQNDPENSAQQPH